jgi:hypothetical protein
MFDFVLVILMILEVWVITLILICTTEGRLSQGDDVLSGASDASILRMLRLLRLTRIARIARLLRYVPELLVIIRGIVAATRSVAVTLTLLALIIYVFAIMFRQLLMDSPPGRRFFNSVPEAMLSLIFYGIILEGTPEVVNEVGATSWFCASLLLLFILVASFTVLNMLIGIMVETVRLVSTVERERMTLSESQDKLLHLLNFSRLDANKNDMISKAELQGLLGVPDACVVLRDLGVDVVSLVDTADLIFQDQDELDFPAFMDVVMQMRGGNKATVHDLIMQRRFLQKEMVRLQNLLCRQMPWVSQPQVDLSSGSPLRPSVCPPSLCLE